MAVSRSWPAVTYSGIYVACHVMLIQLLWDRILDTLLCWVVRHKRVILKPYYTKIYEIQHEKLRCWADSWLPDKYAISNVFRTKCCNIALLLLRCTHCCWRSGQCWAYAELVNSLSTSTPPIPCIFPVRFGVSFRAMYFRTTFIIVFLLPQR